MKFKIIRDRRLIEDNDFIGYNNENRAEKLEFEIPQELNDYVKTINFQTIDSSFFDILEDNTYILKNNITKYDRVRFYLEFKKQISEDKIELIKTSVFTLTFQDSFDVEKEITEEEIQVLDKLILKIDEATKRANSISEDLEEKLKNNYFKGEKGDTGPQGPKGERGEQGPAADISKVEEDIKAIQEAEYQTEYDVEQAIISKGYQTEADVEQTITSKGYQTAKDVEQAITSKGYQNEQEVETKIESYGYITDENLNKKNYATETYVNNKVSSVYKYIGTVSTYSDLAEKEDTVEFGDVYNVEDTGMNYAWKGDDWDALGTTVDLSNYVQQEELEKTNKKFLGTLIDNNDDLDNYYGEDKIGAYYTSGGNNIANKPTGIDAFGMQLIRTANGLYTQLLIPSNKKTGSIFLRTGSNTWTSWIEIQKNINVIDNLTSTSTTDALSANQGKILNEKDTDLDNRTTTLEQKFFNIHSNISKITYAKIGELNTNIENGENNLVILIVGGSNFGYPKIGIDLLQVSTRGKPTLTVKEILNGESRNSEYGYVKNNETGITEIWQKRYAYNSNTKIYILQSYGGGTRAKLFSNEETEPKNIVYVDKITDKTEIIDNLTTTSTTDALSANQGKVLSDKNIELENKITTLEERIAQLESKMEV